MIGEPAVRRSSVLLRLRLGDHLIETVGEETATLQTAVALLRTVFEDHYVDPDHRSCLFFHGCAIAGSRRQSQDFTVVHRDGRVILSDFTFHWKGPNVVSLPLQRYASEIVGLSEQVLRNPIRFQGMPDWQKHYVQTQWTYLNQLTELGWQLLNARCENYPSFCAEYAHLHGRLKRPLELQVLQVEEANKPFQPMSVTARVAFGPIRAGEVLPMRLNLGDLVRVTASRFTTTGVVLTLEGVGSGGVCRGDRLYGLQFFYP